jgi:hypothetical protein
MTEPTIISYAGAAAVAAALALSIRRRVLRNRRRLVVRTIDGRILREIRRVVPIQIEHCPEEETHASKN